MNLYLKIQTNPYHNRGITSKRVTRGGIRLCDLALGQCSSAETSQRWRAVGDTEVKKSAGGIMRPNNAAAVKYEITKKKQKPTEFVSGENFPVSLHLFLRHSESICIRIISKDHLASASISSLDGKRLRRK